VNKGTNETMQVLVKKEEAEEGGPIPSLY